MNKKKFFLIRCKKQKSLIFLAIPIIIYVFIFCYYPLWGWVLSLYNYKPGLKLSDCDFVGWKYFIQLFSNEGFYLALRNTLVMSILLLVFGTIANIFLALVFNEIRANVFKKVVQTVSYLPFFVSSVVVASIFTSLLSTEGSINDLLLGIGVLKEPLMWLGKPNYFWGIITTANIWKGVGYGTIIYLSAMTAIDPGLYEAASIDGAGRLKRIWHITIPGIKSTIVVLLIMNIGGILNTGFEMQMLLGNDLTRNVYETLDLYVLRYGLGLGRYSYSIAAGMFKTIVSLILVFTANYYAKKTDQARLF